MNHRVNLIPPHHHTLLKKLLNYTHQKNLSKGKNLHAYLIKTSLSSSSTYLSNTLVNFYAKSHLFPEALSAFQEIHHKDIVSWNSLINNASNYPLNSSFSVLKLFQQMLQEKTYPNSHTFTGIFAAAANSNDPFSGKQAHSVAIKVADSFDVFVNSSLLNMYSKIGLVSEARKVFDEMPVRNSVTWASMVSGYALERHGVKAFEVFKLMLREQSEDSNEFIFTSALSALALDDYIYMGHQIHSLAIKTGLFQITSVGNAIVTMYTKCGNLNDALKVFMCSSDKNAITWSAMITGCAQSGDGKKALKLFSEMHLINIKPSEYTLVGVLNSCSDTESLIEGKQFHSYVIKFGFETQIYIMTALIDMYAKCGNIKDAKKGFDYLREPDIVLWTSMISGYVQNGENEKAMIMYCKMQIENIIPNELTLASILKACSSLVALEQGKQIHAHSIKYGFNLEVPIGSALSNMYSKCGSLNNANLVFRRMVYKDVVSWNAMISGLSQNGRGNEALKLFDEMLVNNIKPDYVTFVNVLSACSHMGLVEKGWEYFNMMWYKFSLGQKIEHYACMVDILGRAGKLIEAKDLIESVNLDRLCLWRILLSACRNYGNYDLGAYVGEKLMELGTKESSAYVLLASIYKGMGKLKDVERVRKLMGLRGVNKEPGCSWIELRNCVHVFVVGDWLHPEIEDIRGEVRMLSKVMKDEGYEIDFEVNLEEF